MSFTTTDLVNNRVLVEGTDRRGRVGRTVLGSTQFRELSARDDHSLAHEAFDAEVRAFYAPLTAAAEKLEAAHQVQAEDLFTEVVQEAVEATAGQQEIRVHLSSDTVILRLLEQGDDERLIWVNGYLEITAPVTSTEVHEPETDVVPETGAGNGGSEPTA